MKNHEKILGNQGKIQGISRDKKVRTLYEMNGTGVEWVCPGGMFTVTPPPRTWDTTGYGRQVGGTHPTGMLSCLYCYKVPGIY